MRFDGCCAYLECIFPDTHVKASHRARKRNDGGTAKLLASHAYVYKDVTHLTEMFNMWDRATKLAFSYC